MKDYTDKRSRRQKLVDRLYGRNMPTAVLVKKLHRQVGHIGANARVALDNSGH